MHPFALGMLLAATPATMAAAQAGPVPAVQGRIVDVLGDPVPAAEVRALVHGRVAACTHGDGDGLYLLRPPAGTSELRVAAPGKVEARLPWRATAAAAVRNVVLEDGVVLRGQVHDRRGAAAAHAAIVVLARDVAAIPAVADAAGAFEIHGVPLRPVLVRAVAEHGWAQTELRVTADTTVALTLDPAETSTLVQVHGLPPGAHAGATLRVYGADVAAVLDDGRLPLAADGSATVMLQAACLLDLTLPGLAVSPARRVAGPADRRIAFTVTGPAPPPETTPLRGTVRTLTGRPCAGERVLVRDRSHGDLGSAETGRDGTFELRIAQPPDGFVRYAIAGSELVLAGEVTLRDARGWQGGFVGDAAELWVERAGTLRTTVPAGDGNVFAFADVVVEDRDRLQQTRRTHTDVAGELTLGLPPGRHDVLVVAHDGAVCRAEITAEAGTATPARWQRLRTGALGGVLLDAQARPVAGSEVFVFQEADARDAVRDHCTVRTDRHGRFRCRGLPAGDWFVVARGDAPGEPIEVRVVAGEEARIALAAGR